LRSVPDRLPEPATLRRGATTLGVELDLDQASALIVFGELLLRWNRAFNLISRKDEDRLYHRHLLDSLSVAPWLSGSRILDLGTGAGLPGIPLAIASPRCSFVLVDRHERKIRFVRQAARELGLENVTTWCGDITSSAAPGDCDTVVTRAVAAPAEAWRLARGVLRPGGRLLLMAHGQGEAGIEEAVPDDAQVVARVRIPIPGLALPHGLLVLERVAASVERRVN
jgi:16S rRNA (guanine527-N7)-methyltransferase